MMKPIVPPASIGIIGGGQLGMMTVREAQRMGYTTVIWDPDVDCPASRLADSTIVAPFTDTRAAGRLADAADVVTYEFENVDPACVEAISRKKPMLPGSEILKVSRHRRIEKETLQQAGFPVVDFRIAANDAEIRKAVEELGFPVVVKTTTAGYDGKGQTVLQGGEDLALFLSEQNNKTEFVVERFLPLQVEVSVVAVRGHDGSVTTFPVVDNEHRENILHVTRVPTSVNPETEKRARSLATSIVRHFGIVGVLCVEMFVTRRDEVLVNELAPRPHNSGHYSLDASSISQFEALVRSVCGIPMQEPRLLSPCAMVNLLGKHLQRIDLRKVQEIHGVKVHVYGKKRMEPKRKMGHITITGPSREEVESNVQVIEAMIGEGAGIMRPEKQTMKVV